MSFLAWLQAMARTAEPTTTPHTAPDSGAIAPVGGLDPFTTADDPDTVSAALAYARDSGADPQSRLLWARYAHDAAKRLFGDAHPVALRAGRVYQNVLAEQGRSLDAVLIAGARLADCERARDQVQALTSRCAYAIALHRHGFCEQAEHQSRLSLRTWWASPHGFGHAATVLLSAAAIRAGCGRIEAAVDVLVVDAAYLVHLDGASRRMAARWLALTATTHHRLCGHTPPAVAPGHDQWQQETFWLSVLETPHLHDARTSDYRSGQAS